MQELLGTRSLKFIALLVITVNFLKLLFEIGLGFKLHIILFSLTHIERIETTVGMMDNLKDEIIVL